MLFFNHNTDAHPIHLHLVFFEVVDRYEVVFDNNAVDGEIPDGQHPAGDGTYLKPQPIVQHNGEVGTGFKVRHPTKGDKIDKPFWYFDNGPKDTVMALPGEVTIIRATFDKIGDCK